MNDCKEPEASCDYCGLPLPSSWLGESRLRPGGAPQAVQAAEEKRYCCYGCRFVAAVTQERGEAGAVNWTLTRLGVAIFLSMNVMVFTMVLWTQEAQADTLAGTAYTAVLRSLFRYLCLILAVPVLLLLGEPLLANAWSDCRRGRLGADLLLMIGVGAAYLYSIIGVVRDQGPIYFEVGCAVLVLVTLGKWLEASCKLRAAASLEGLHRLLPDQARIARGGGATEMVPLADVAAGDLLHVLPGERIPCDGEVASGTSSVDEQVLTGESQPAMKAAGDRVFGGSLALDGRLAIAVSAPARTGALARMIDLVEQARRTRGRCERAADRAAAWFLPAVVLTAAGTLAWHGVHHGLGEGILAALAVVLIACPCALGLATPLTVWAALGRAAREQVLFKSGEALEKLADVRAVRFDKTGTLTTGTPEVAHFAAAAADEDEVLEFAAALTAASNHSYSAAIGQFVATRRRSESFASASPDCARTVPGLGLAAEIHGRSVWLGSERFMTLQGLACPETMAGVAADIRQTGNSPVFLGWDGSIRGVFALAEKMRPEAAAVAAELAQMGIDVGVLTGDSAARGEAAARELGVPVRAECLPEDKVAALAESRRRHGCTAMVGDGINDAPALAGCDVGIALGCGTDLSRDAAAVCLLGNNLRQLTWAIRLARHTLRVIRQNLFWAFGYNVAGIGLACAGLLNPIIAALAMVLSSFFVVANAIRLSSE